MNLVLPQILFPVGDPTIVEEVERLHRRLWNGKAKDAQISFDRIRAVMHHFQGAQGERKSIAPSRKLWTALHALEGYLTGRAAGSTRGHRPACKP